MEFLFSDKARFAFNAHGFRMCLSGTPIPISVQVTPPMTESGRKNVLKTVEVRPRTWGCWRFSDICRIFPIAMGFEHGKISMIFFMPLRF